MVTARSIHVHNLSRTIEDDVLRPTRTAKKMANRRILLLAHQVVIQ